MPWQEGVPGSGAPRRGPVTDGMWEGALVCLVSFAAVAGGLELRFPGELAPPAKHQQQSSRHQLLSQSSEDRRLIEPSPDAAILAQVLAERYKNSSVVGMSAQLQQDDPRGFQHTLAEMLGKSQYLKSSVKICCVCSMNLCSSMDYPSHKVSERYIFYLKKNEELRARVNSTCRDFEKTAL